MHYISITFYILTVFDDLSNFCYIQHLHLCLLRGNAYIFSAGVVNLVARSDSAQSENTYFHHVLWTLYLEQMVTYGIIILLQRNFALHLGKKGIGTQGLKLEVAAKGKMSRKWQRRWV